MTYLIEVTQQDIDKGIRGNSCACPVAWAIRSAIGDGDIEIRVGEDLITVGNAQVPVPKIAYRFIRAFDYGLYSVEPFTFTLEVPERP